VVPLHSLNAVTPRHTPTADARFADSPNAGSARDPAPVWL